MDQKGESACVEVYKDIYTIAVKEWLDNKPERLDVSVFDGLVNNLNQRLCLDKNQWINALVLFYLQIIAYYYFTPSPNSVSFSI